MLSMRRRCARSLAQLLEMAIEARAQQTSLSPIGAGPGQHDEVPRRQSRLVAKGFAGEAFDFVAVHGTFRGATRDRQTEAGARAAGRARENGEVAIARTRGLGEHSSELRRCVQSLIRGETCCAGKQRRAKTGLATA